jgi:hypothetical protein
MIKKKMRSNERYRAPAGHPANENVAAIAEERIVRHFEYAGSS